MGHTIHLVFQELGVHLGDKPAISCLFTMRPDKKTASIHEETSGISKEAAAALSERFDNLEVTMAYLLTYMIRMQIVANVDKDEIKDLTECAHFFMRNLPRLTSKTLSERTAPSTVEQDDTNDGQLSEMTDEFNFKRNGKKKKKDAGAPSQIDSLDATKRNLKKKKGVMPLLIKDLDTTEDTEGSDSDGLFGPVFEA
jgi:hypothetical protein